MTSAASDHVERLAEDVIVIGAGPAGIASAYALEQAGIAYKVIDRAKIIGSTWCNLYPSLKLNTSRYFSHMPGAPFPQDYGIFPTGRQYYEYLINFAEQHNFNIQLGVEVKRVVPEDDLWRVETNQGTWLVPVVIAATGIFGRPVVPDDVREKLRGFTGTWLHAHDFRTAEQVRGQRVLVVGNGPSGVDISAASGEVAAETTLLIRSGIVLRRRYPLGLPKHLWLMLADALLPKGWCHLLLRQVGRIDYGDVSYLGLNPPPPGTGGLTPYAGRELIDAVKAGHVQPKIGEMTHCEGDIVHFSDGTRQQIDTMILATGYLPVLHQYLDIDLPLSDTPPDSSPPCDWLHGPNGERGWPLRDTSQHPNGRQVLGYPGLYLVGTYYKGKGAMSNMNIEAQIATEQISTYLKQHESAIRAVAN